MKGRPLVLAGAFLALLSLPPAPALVAADTHGPDLLPILPDLKLPSADPICAATQAFQVLYVLAPSTLDLFDVREPEIRAGLRASQGVVLETSLAHGVDVRLRFVCDADGEIDIQKVRIPTPPLAARFSTIVADLRAAGYDDAERKYWVLYEPPLQGCSACLGQGNVRNDDRAGPDNANNDGAMYAITYLGNFGAQSNLATLTNVMLHEATHTMGGVQLSAPHSSLLWHCTDGSDVMCYADGGPHAFDALACPRLVATRVGPELPYDCGADDYFHPAPAAGSYLASRWNVGAAVNRWIEWQRLDPQPTTL